VERFSLETVPIVVYNLNAKDTGLGVFAESELGLMDATLYLIILAVVKCLEATFNFLRVYCGSVLEKRCQGSRNLRLAKPLTSFSISKPVMNNVRKRKNYVFSLNITVKGGRTL
jgi:hypothetical protein